MQRDIRSAGDLHDLARSLGRKQSRRTDQPNVVAAPGKTLDNARRVRDEIRERVDALIAELDAASSLAAWRAVAEGQSVACAPEGVVCLCAGFRSNGGASAHPGYEPQEYADDRKAREGAQRGQESGKCRTNPVKPPPRHGRTVHGKFLKR